MFESFKKLFKKPTVQQQNQITKVSVEMYRDTLRRYYERYENNVFQQNILLMLHNHTGYSIEQIRHDLKEIRKELGYVTVNGQNVKINSNPISNEEYLLQLAELYLKFGNNAFQRLKSIKEQTNYDIETIKRDLTSVRDRINREAVEEYALKHGFPKSNADSKNISIDKSNNTKYGTATFQEQYFQQLRQLYQTYGSVAFQRLGEIQKQTQYPMYVIKQDLKKLREEEYSLQLEELCIKYGKSAKNHTKELERHSGYTRDKIVADLKKVRPKARSINTNITVTGREEISHNTNIGKEHGEVQTEVLEVSEEINKNGMKRMLAVTMKWVIHYTDGDTWVQTNTYPYDYDTLFYKRKEIIEECVMIYGDNIDYIDFTVIVSKGVETKLDRYLHRKMSRLEISIKLNKDKNKLYVECFDDETCKNITDFRDAWVALNGMRYYGENLAKYMCELSQKSEYHGGMPEVMFKLSLQCLQSLTPIQRETLTRAYEWGAEHNSIVFLCDKKEILDNYFFKKIAEIFGDEGKVLHIFEDERLNSIYKKYANYHLNIADDYYRTKDWRGNLVSPLDNSITIIR
ncbi:MAG: hypothetical protein IJN54_00905 [Lachnospiraceae bacterium]|nr:hypothetical protein [Lachnospiraceae bacterium]